MREITICFLFNTDAVTDQRLLIVITQHDLFYTAPNTEVELNETNLTTYVKSMLRRRQLDISHLVTPVSGFWALLANNLQNQPNSTGIE